MHRGEYRPHKKRDYKVIISRIEPDRVENELDDKCDRQGIYKIKELKGHLVDDERRYDKCEYCDYPRAGLGNVSDRSAVEFFFLLSGGGHLFLRMLCLYKVIKRNAKDVCDLKQNGYIGGGFGSLPF